MPVGSIDADPAAIVIDRPTLIARLSPLFLRCRARDMTTPRSIGGKIHGHGGKIYALPLRRGGANGRPAVAGDP
jgi:hypothetical protein